MNLNIGCIETVLGQQPTGSNAKMNLNIGCIETVPPHQL